MKQKISLDNQLIFRSPVNKERSGQMIPEKRQRSPLFPYFFR
ncbi:hypothetical protein [Paenibacillus periandrae]|nr:hypothetical protein [Paenibacillus periandrae]